MRIYKRENGTWYLELSRDKRRSLKTSNKRQAERIFREILEKGVAAGLTGDEGLNPLTLKEFTRQYLLGRTNVKAANTVRLDTEALDRLAETIPDTTLLHDIKEKQGEQFVRELLSEGLEHTTINIKLRALKAAFNKAVRWRHIKESPFRYVDQLEVKDSLPRALDTEEVKALLEAAEGAKYYFKEFLYTSLYTAGRRTSIAKLEWQDFKSFTTPAKETGENETHWTVTLKNTKTKVHTLPLAENLREVLFYRKQKEGPVFPFFHKHYREPSRFFKKVADKASLDGVVLHDLRHTAATFMVLNGVPLSMVQGILGHSTIRMTEVYTKVAALHLREGIGTLKF